MIERMWEILTTFTEESQQAALAKCKELGFDPNRGVVSLDESFINLNSAAQTLKDAIEKKKLIQLPITVQKMITSYLEAISKHQAGLIAGTDEVVNLANAIEQLNTAMWQYGLDNLSDEVLGYQSKLNQLKTLEVEAKRLKRELDAGVKVKENLNQLLSDAGKQSESLQKLVTGAGESATKASEEMARATDSSQKSAALLATIQQNEATSKQQLAATTTSNAEVSVLEKKIKEFYAQVDEYRTKITTTSDDARNAVQENKAETDKLVSTLRDLETKIKAQIQKATGFSLFHSFQTRQEALRKSKRYWVGALAGLVVASIGLSLYVIHTTNSIDAAFFLKLSMSLPLIYAIAFCTIQYSRERKLEEEYAFESNISISLVPYQELVEKIVAKEQPEERQRYAAFIIDAITKVFTSPTEMVFESPEKHKGLSEKAVKQLATLIEPIVKGLKP